MYRLKILENIIPLVQKQRLCWSYCTYVKLLKLGPLFQVQYGLYTLIYKR